MSIGALSLVMLVCRGISRHRRSGVDLLDLMDDGYRDDDAGSHHSLELAEPEARHTFVVTDEVDYCHVVLLACGKGYRGFARWLWVAALTVIGMVVVWLVWPRPPRASPARGAALARAPLRCAKGAFVGGCWGRCGDGGGWLFGWCRPLPSPIEGLLHNIFCEVFRLSCPAPWARSPSP